MMKIQSKSSSKPNKKMSRAEKAEEKRRLKEQKAKLMNDIHEGMEFNKK